MTIRFDPSSNSDGAFYEKFVNRKGNKRGVNSAARDPSEHGRLVRDGRVKWTPEKKEALKRMWADGTMIKIIAIEIEMGQTAIRNMRRTLKLRPRATPNGGTDRGLKVFFYVPRRLEAKIRKRVQQKGTTRSHYLQMLIEKDTEHLS